MTGFPGRRFPPRGTPRRGTADAHDGRDRNTHGRGTKKIFTKNLDLPIDIYDKSFILVIVPPLEVAIFRKEVTKNVYKMGIERKSGILF